MVLPDGVVRSPGMTAISTFTATSAFRTKQEWPSDAMPLLLKLNIPAQKICTAYTIQGGSVFLFMPKNKGTDIREILTGKA